MRIVGEIEHPAYKITIMQNMGRFIVKFESDATEQSYKIRESEDLKTAEDIKKKIDEKFLAKVDKVFLSLSDNLMQLLVSNLEIDEDEEGEWTTEII